MSRATLFGTSRHPLGTLYGWRIVCHLAAYFRGAEYPMGRIESYREAIKMRASGWPS